MLAHPEIGTREHIKLWVYSQPPEKEFCWSDSRFCACAEYSNAHRALYTSKAVYGGRAYWIDTVPVAELNQVAHKVADRSLFCRMVSTYGDLAKELTARGW